MNVSVKFAKDEFLQKLAADMAIRQQHFIEIPSASNYRALELSMLRYQRVFSSEKEWYKTEFEID